ncbi:SPARC-like protein 1 [Sorex araneus]|uniref:SPARC-like protein 1 n=1 Tax=Sorex araneus TaxID=42254 RepID=UPI002433BA65|nr:SPARC-like protein 1 [Sorex araneus]
MKTLLLFLSVLGAVAAVPTNARFLRDDFEPTADSSSSAPQAEILGTPASTEIPILNGEDEENEKETSDSLEDHLKHKSKEESDNPDDQDPSHSPEPESKVLQEKDGDISENLEDAPTEGTLELREDESEPQKKELPENTDFLAPDVASVVDSDPHESTTNAEKAQEEPVSDPQPHSNGSSKQSQDLSEPDSQTQGPKSSSEEREEEKESGEVGVNQDDQEKESESPKKHPGTPQGEESTKSDIAGESEQPTQVSKMQKDAAEQDNQEDPSDTEAEDETSSKVKKHQQDSEWPNQEEKSGLEGMSDEEEMEKKSVSEPLPIEPADDEGDIIPGNHEADDDENDDDDDEEEEDEEDGHRHSANEDDATPSQASLQSEGSQSDYHHLKSEEQRERAHEKENSSEAGQHHGATKKAESLAPEDGGSSEGDSRLHSADVCMNFQCKRGHMCKANQQGKPHCVCQDPMTCPPAKLLDQVCGTDNQTYPSSCHLFATKCRMEGTKRGHQLQLDYFGACKSIPVCTDFEVAQFPLRMRDWLKNILMQLYEPNPEHNGYLNEKQRNKVKKIYLDEKRLLAGDHSIDLLLRDFKKNYHMYVYPVHWQFSELDQHPTDRVLTHSELAPLRASLVPMEHCITRFFEECDPNKDKHITLKEWGHCFGIKEEDIDENLLF